MSESTPLLRAGDGAAQAVGVAVKRLAAVDLPSSTSNQHELNGVAQLREILGEQRINDAPIRWHVLSDSDTDLQITASTATWYDSRGNVAGRSPEWRLYYRDPSGLESAEEGDLVYLISFMQDGRASLLAYVIAAESSWDNQLAWLFGIETANAQAWAVRDASELRSRAREISAVDLLESLEIGQVTADVRPADFELIRHRFGIRFPATKEFSAFAREESEFSYDDPADFLLVQWIKREEELFRALEDYIVRSKLDDGFDDVDDFIAFSLSVQNRRKSRMGYSLENHLTAIFDAHRIPYSYNRVTENKSRPDFLFPGIDEYRDSSFPDDHLQMLGAKSSCKERWRQVLSEAARIRDKHLCTLEPGISENQTDEMKANNLQLVVPERVKRTYTNDQQSWLMSLEEFMELVRGE